MAEDASGHSMAKTTRPKGEKAATMGGEAAIGLSQGRPIKGYRFGGAASAIKRHERGDLGLNLGKTNGYFYNNK